MHKNKEKKVHINICPVFDLISELQPFLYFDNASVAFAKSVHFRPECKAAVVVSEFLTFSKISSLFQNSQY